MSDAVAAFASEVGDSGAVVVRGAGTRWDVGGLPSDDAREVRAPAGISYTTPPRRNLTQHRPEETLHNTAQKKSYTTPPRRNLTPGSYLTQHRPEEILHNTGQKKSYTTPARRNLTPGSYLTQHWPEEILHNTGKKKSYTR